MEVMGVVDTCGQGAGAWQDERVVAMPKGANGGFAEYAVCPGLGRELGAEIAINYYESDFAQIVMEKSADRGVDVVYDNVGEAVMHKSMSCVAYSGRYLMRDRRARAGRESAARDRQGRRVRWDSRGDRGACESRDRGANDREAVIARRRSPPAAPSAPAIRDVSKRSLPEVPGPSRCGSSSPSKQDSPRARDEQKP